MLDDVRRLLDADGLAEVPVIADQRPRRHRHRRAAAARSPRRVAGEEGRPGPGSRPTSGPPPRASTRPPATRPARRARPTSGSPRSRTRFAEAAGVPTVVDAVERSTRMRAGRATGWPVTAWLSRLQARPAQAAPPRPRRRRAGSSPAARAPRCPQATQVQRARVDTEVRALADDVSAGLARPWARRRTPGLGLAARRPRRPARRARSADTDLGAARIPVWAGVVRLLQWLLIARRARSAALWLRRARRCWATCSCRSPRRPRSAGVPVPTLLLRRAAWCSGSLLALVCRFAGRRRPPAAGPAAADRRLREAVARASPTELVVEPVEAELAAYTARARPGSPRRCRLADRPAVRPQAGSRPRSSTGRRRARSPAVGAAPRVSVRDHTDRPRDEGDSDERDHGHPAGLARQRRAAPPGRRRDGGELPAWPAPRGATSGKTDEWVDGRHPVVHRQRLARPRPSNCAPRCAAATRSSSTAGSTPRPGSTRPASR